MQLYNQLPYPDITPLEFEHPIGGAYIEATTGGTLGITFWEDDSHEDAFLRATGIRCMMFMPRPLLRETVADLVDALRSYYRQPELRPGPPPREMASAGTLRQRPDLKIEA
jgi:hypothetical protein